MKLPKAVLFDLDDTLAESFCPPVPDMIMLLRQLLDMVPVAILSGASYERVQKDLIVPLEDHPHIERLFVFPNSAAQCYVSRDGVWHMEYNFALTVDERARISSSINASITELGIKAEDPHYRSQIINREVQIAYAGVGIDAPMAVKRAWDPDQMKRKKLNAALQSRLPEFEIMIGGTTTIDITRKGINKAYGVEWLAKRLGLPPSEMLFIGDTLYKGGNDAVVIPTGIQIRLVANPAETAQVIDELLSDFAKGH